VVECRPNSSELEYGCSGHDIPVPEVRFGRSSILAHKARAVEFEGVLLPSQDLELVAPPQVTEGFNAAHGAPLTLGDRRAFAARLLHSRSDWSDREIGRRCGLVEPTVAKVRHALEQQGQIPVTNARVGRDGRAYDAKRRRLAFSENAETDFELLPLVCWRSALLRSGGSKRDRCTLYRCSEPRRPLGFPRLRRAPGGKWS
jgi:hypothetical protein